MKKKKKATPKKRGILAKVKNSREKTRATKYSSPQYLATTYGLTDLQVLFCHEYMVDLNIRSAGVRAGLSPMTAYEYSGNKNIQSAINYLMQKRVQRTQITADKVLQELAKIGFHDVKHFLDYDENGVVSYKPSDLVDTAPIAEISQIATKHGTSTRLRFHDKLKSLELLGKHLNIFQEDEDAKTPKVTVNVLHTDNPNFTIKLDGREPKAILNPARPHLPTVLIEEAKFTTVDKKNKGKTKKNANKN